MVAFIFVSSVLIEFHIGWSSYYYLYDKRYNIYYPLFSDRCQSVIVSYSKSQPVLLEYGCPREYVGTLIIFLNYTPLYSSLLYPQISQLSMVISQLSMIISQLSMVISQLSMIISQLSMIISQLSMIISQLSMIISQLSMIISQLSMVISFLCWWHIYYISLFHLN